MHKIKATFNQNKLWTWVVLFTCLSIPLHNDYSSKALVISYVFAAIQLRKTKFIFSFFGFFCALYLVWNSFQIFNSENMALAIKEFERKSSFLILPLLWLPIHLDIKSTLNVFIKKALPIFTGGLCLILFSLVWYSNYDSFTIGHFSYHDLVNSINANAIYFSCFLIISLYQLLSHYKNSGKLVFGALLFIHLSFLYLLASKIFWILTLGLLLYFALKTQKKIKQYATIACIVIFGLGLSQTGKIKDRYAQIIEKPFIINNADISPNTEFTGINFRIFLIQQGIEMITKDYKSFFIGYGLGDTQQLLNQKIIDNNLYIGETDGENQGFLNYNFHNQYIQTWVESGFIGLLLLLSIPFSLLAFGWKTKNESLIVLNLIFLLAFFTESYLNRYMGIMMFLSFNSIFLSKSFSLKENYSLLKRGFDLCISICVILFLLSWLIPLLSFILWLDSRQSPLFIQKRMGKDGVIFKCYKLKTMIVNDDADKLIAQINDSRITRIGHFYRKFGLDELPQFFNVLTGDMSIVGPRPLMISEEENYNTLIPNFSSRLNGKPGITGLAQCLGKKGYVNNIYDIRERYKIDKLYLNNASITLDIKILFLTIYSMYLKKTS